MEMKNVDVKPGSRCWTSILWADYSGNPSSRPPSKNFSAIGRAISKFGEYTEPEAGFKREPRWTNGVASPARHYALAAEPTSAYLPGDLKLQVAAFVTHYNHARYHESLDNLTPADVYPARAEAVLLERERIKRQTIANRRLALISHGSQRERAGDRLEGFGGDGDADHRSLNQLRAARVDANHPPRRLGLLIAAEDRKYYLRPELTARPQGSVTSGALELIKLIARAGIPITRESSPNG
jgi:hypothetical protein